MSAKKKQTKNSSDYFTTKIPKINLYLKLYIYIYIYIYIIYTHTETDMYTHKHIRIYTEALMVQ